MDVPYRDEEAHVAEKKDPCRVLFLWCRCLGEAIEAWGTKELVNFWNAMLKSCIQYVEIVSTSRQRKYFDVLNRMAAKSEALNLQDLSGTATSASVPLVGC